MKSEDSRAAVGDDSEQPHPGEELDTARPLAGEDAYDGKTVLRAVPSEILRAARQARQPAAAAAPPKVVLQPGDEVVPGPPQLPSELRWSATDALLEQLEAEAVLREAGAVPKEPTIGVEVGQPTAAAPVAELNAAEEAQNSTASAVDPCALAPAPALRDSAAAEGARPAGAELVAATTKSVESRIPTVRRTRPSAAETNAAKTSTPYSRVQVVAVWMMWLTSVFLAAYLLAR